METDRQIKTGKACFLSQNERVFTDSSLLFGLHYLTVKITVVILTD